MSEHKMYPYPHPDMDAGRSAKKVSDAMTPKGQDTAEGVMGNQKTGDGMENEKGVGGGSSHNPGSSHKRGMKY